ncbi:unnamed protein product [Auanema sp. JU1783]|nr:unnamed protein product [Auanema sp. JU1783]
MDSSGSSLLPKGKIIGSKWKVIRKLGEGGCGSVFKVLNLASNPTDPELAALKAEQNSDINVLKLEIQVLQRLEGKPYVAQLLYSGKKENVSYVIMTLMGESLANLLKRVGGRVTKSTLVRVAVNILFCIKQIHDIGFVHRDLKPANIAIGNPATGRHHFLHVLDFGLSRMFVTQKAGKVQLRKPREQALFRGTTRYCSINVHNKKDQCRVDDLWSFMYMLAEMRAPLPWKHIQTRTQIGESKRTTPLSKVFQCFPETMIEICNYLSELDFFTRPDYHWIATNFFDIIRENKYKFTDPYDWENLNSKNAVITMEEITNQTRRPNSASDAREPTNSSDSLNKTLEEKPNIVISPEDPFPEEYFRMNTLGV